MSSQHKISGVGDWAQFDRGFTCGGGGAPVASLIGRNSEDRVLDIWQVGW